MGLGMKKIEETIKLPDDILNTFVNLVSKEETSKWSIGDFINDVYAEYKKYLGKIPMRIIIEELSRASGYNPSTLRDRARMSAIITLDKRKEYEPLSYHQFRACLFAGEKWEEYARYACDNFPVSVEAIRRKIKDDNNGGSIGDIIIARIYSGLEYIIYHGEHYPENIINLAIEMMEVIDKYYRNDNGTFRLREGAWQTPGH